MMEAQGQLQSLYKKKVHLVARGDGQPEGISVYSPGFSESVLNSFMTDHYLGNTHDATDLSSMHDHYRRHIKSALELAKKDPNSIKSVLELGAGQGSATVPILEIFENAQIIATELSPHMLTGLSNRLATHPQQKRLSLLQLNAEEIDFKENTFDLVVGAALLHHLFEPAKTLAQVAQVLNPGGLAIFFEPFEDGMGIVRLIYETVLRDPRSVFLRPRFKSYLRDCVQVWNKMIQSDKTLVKGQDDKWFFSRQHFEVWADSAGFSSTRFFTLNQSEKPYAELISHHMAGNGFSRHPKWIDDITQSFEQSLSSIVKKDLFTEAGLVLKK